MSHNNGGTKTAECFELFEGINVGVRISRRETRKPTQRLSLLSPGDDQDAPSNFGQFADVNAKHNRSADGQRSPPYKCYDVDHKDFRIGVSHPVVSNNILTDGYEARSIANSIITLKRERMSSKVFSYFIGLQIVSYILLMVLLLLVGLRVADNGRKLEAITVKLAAQK